MNCGCSGSFDCGQEGDGYLLSITKYSKERIHDKGEKPNVLSLSLSLGFSSLVLRSAFPGAIRSGRGRIWRRGLEAARGSHCGKRNTPDDAKLLRAHTVLTFCGFQRKHPSLLVSSERMSGMAVHCGMEAFFACCEHFCPVGRRPVASLELRQAGNIREEKR